MKKYYTQRKAENFVKIGQDILNLLNEPISKPELKPKFALLPTQPGLPYDKPLPTTQDLEMQPFLSEVLPIMRALDAFNIRAAQHLRAVEEEKEKLESDGTSKIPLVVAGKRSASDAKLDGQPPTKRSDSNAGFEVKPLLKRMVSSAQAKEIMSVGRPQNGIKTEHSSPRQSTEIVSRLKSPHRATWSSDHWASYREPRLVTNWGASGISGNSPSKGDYRPRRGSSTNGGSSYLPVSPKTSPNRVSFSLPTSTAKNLNMDGNPRPSSRDPRLHNRAPRLRDR